MNSAFSLVSHPSSLCVCVCVCGFFSNAILRTAQLWSDKENVDDDFCMRPGDRRGGEWTKPNRLMPLYRMEISAAYVRVTLKQ